MEPAGSGRSAMADAATGGRPRRWRRRGGRALLPARAGGTLGRGAGFRCGGRLLGADSRRRCGLGRCVDRRQRQFRSGGRRRRGGQAPREIELLHALPGASTRSFRRRGFSLADARGAHAGRYLRVRPGCAGVRVGRNGSEVTPSTRRDHREVRGLATLCPDLPRNPVQPKARKASGRKAAYERVSRGGGMDSIMDDLPDDRLRVAPGSERWRGETRQFQRRFGSVCTPGGDRASLVPGGVCPDGGAKSARVVHARSATNRASAPVTHEPRSRGSPDLPGGALPGLVHAPRPTAGSRLSCRALLAAAGRLFCTTRSPSLSARGRESAPARFEPHPADRWPRGAGRGPAPRRRARVRRAGGSRG
jgi:hypothetical protein